MSDLDALVARANGGDAAALEELVGSVRDRVYRLALRMVTRPADAEDATQEILIRVMTRLSTYRGDAAFTTWVHRVAVNHLLDRKKTAVERLELDFDAYAEDLRSGLATEVSPDAALLADEIRLSCTQAMLTCLDRDHRVAYVLGEVFGVCSPDGAYICNVSPGTYRKRLSRARARVRAFVERNCGLVNPQGAPCRCERRVETAVALGRIDPTRPEFSTHPVVAGVTEMEKLHDAADLMRSHPDYAAPAAMADRIVELIRSGRYRLLDHRSDG
jgi:RNA polymerase sigma factor (sigma-70 family)